MAWSWVSNKSSRVTAFRDDVPTEKMSFDGINASDSFSGGFGTKTLNPYNVVRGINRFNALFSNFHFKVDGVTRSLKSEGVES